ncbi:MAG: hypothetical protein PHV82_05010 [Victivallaceae bacterium]|nr:hypothetical protein [Victivallaceae bacterium]
MSVSKKSASGNLHSLRNVHDILRQNNDFIALSILADKIAEHHKSLK